MTKIKFNIPGYTEVREKIEKFMDVFNRVPTFKEFQQFHFDDQNMPVNFFYRHCVYDMLNHQDSDMEAVFTNNNYDKLFSYFGENDASYKTKCCRELLTFLVAFCGENGYFPSYSDIM